MNEMDDINNEDRESEIRDKLREIVNEIRESWARDTDKTEYMIKFIEMLKEMITHDNLEEYFSNNEKDLSLFMGDCLQEIINHILIQPIIYGDNGDSIGVNLLFYIFKLFLKFHKNKKYAPLFERIRNIFNNKEHSNSFFTSHRYQDREDENKHDYQNFNEQFCLEFRKQNSNKKFKEGDEVEFPIENPHSKGDFDKKSWVRGKIKEIRNDEYVIQYFDDDEKVISINDYNIFEPNTKATDWDWRTNLKKYDVIDCYDRSRWYPATITDVKEEENNGYKKISYHVAFRLYTKHFKNPEDENDTYDKHIDIWKNNFSSSIDVKNEGEDEEYIGDHDNYSEDIEFYSKRIQKFNVYSSVQQKHLEYQYSSYNFSSNNNDDKNPLKIMYDKLTNDTCISIDDFYNYEVNGKKNCILGKSDNKFFYYYALLLKVIEKDNGFTEFIEILKDKPNTEEIYTIFYILTCSFPYLHKGYFIENSNILKTSLLDYINSLNEKEMRNLPKDLTAIVLSLLYNINEYNIDENDCSKSSSINIYDEVTITLSLKTIKTSIFDRRLQGIKALNDFIEKNEKNKDILKRIIALIKENKIISEIFGANYHSQIISRANEIVKLLLVENELENDDIKLIWSCTKRGDLEAKLTILKLLSEIAPYLKEDYIEMLLTNIISNVDKKINQEEIELVYKLSIQGNDNEKNIILCCDYLCKCLLMSENSNIKNNPLLEKLLLLVEKNDNYLGKVLDICENCIKNNDRTILSYSILYEIMDKYINESNEKINEFIKDNHLLKLFEDNFHLYVKQVKELLTKNNITFSDGEIIDKYIFDGFSHLDNAQKRMEVYPFLINKLYTDYDFIPFLKEVLITNSVSPNDQLIFYDFVKKYISNNESTDDDARKEKIRQELFEILSENKQTDITLEQLKLFIALFFDMNKEKIKLKDINKYEESNKEIEYEIIEVNNIDDLIGLDKLWNIIFQIKEEKILSVAVKIIFQIYKNKNIEKLLEKISKQIKEENVTSETMDKCITILKLIIVESEKSCLFKPKSHLALIKNCLINLPLDLPGKRTIDNDDTEKYILMGNTTFNDLKILISKLYNISPLKISFEYSKDYMKLLKKSKEKKIDENYNNTSLYEIILENSKNIEMKNLKLKDILSFDSENVEKEKLMINGEMNPILKNIIKEWFKIFTNGEEKMDRAGIVRFIQNVTKNTSEIDENSSRVNDFLKANRKNEEDEFITEDLFVEFYNKALLQNKDRTVWANLKEMNIGEDLRRKDEPFEINFEENDKLPRYKLGNDLSFIENLIKQYYKNPNSNSSLIDFLLYLTTNESIYNDVLENLFNKSDASTNKDSFVNKVLNDNENNNYAEQDYIFIIIESILQDLEIFLYNKYNQLNENILFGHNIYKLISEKYEPFDSDGKKEKKLSFVKNLLKSENLEKIITKVNGLFERLSKANNEKENENASKLYDCCMRGLKIINIINNFCEDNVKENQNCVEELKEKGIFNLGFCNLSLLFPDINVKEEMNKISYLDLANNLINYLNDSQMKENQNESENDDDCLQKECLNLLINLLCSKNQLLEEFTSRDETKKNLMINLFKNYFSGKESPNKAYFIQSITLSINKANNNKNNNYILFLFKLVNSLLDSLFNSQMETDEGEPTEKKDIFTPDNTFFSLYNNLYKIISENKDNRDEPQNENSITFKIYDLLMKIIDNIEKGKKVDIKIFISLLKLLEAPIKENPKLKNEILFKETNGKSLYQFLLQKCITQFKKEEKKEESLIDTDNNENNENEENNKFICLENLKEEKKEDNSNEELIKISNKFILQCFEGTREPKLIAELLKMINLIRKARKRNGNESDSDDDNKNEETNITYHNFSTKSCGHVGLKNLGCTCYMNSIIQQLYMCPTFRYAIMSVDDGEPEKPSSGYRHSVEDDNLLHQLQIMYTYLTYSDRMDYNPRDFCYSYKDFDGNPMNVGSQQDSQEFYNNFCDKIENALKKTKFKYIVSDVFAGKTCSSVTCENCKHTSNRFEDFYNLTLEVKNITNLNDSLQKLSVPEIIDDFKCSNCNEKVTIKKVTALNKLPNVLVVHLKRFYLNYETCQTQKINSKFEFPKYLDLKEFCTEQFNKDETLETYNRVDDYYQYELKGINVHTGSADGGHYFSFIDVNRDGKDNSLSVYPKENWLQFNDSHVSEFDTDTIQSECFGGNSEGRPYENIQNAYLLIYERKTKTPVKILIEKKDIDKEKEKENIVTINKDNKSAINKEYDLSRIKPDVKEEDLYKKIFFDEEKDEYFKYIPYYNIPKYAPRKVYNEIMKENNTSPSPKSDNNKSKINLKEFKKILYDIIQDNDFDINDKNYNDESKEIIISIILNNFMKKINSNQRPSSDEKEQINKEFDFIINKLMKPLIKEDTNIDILKIINKYISNEDNLKIIFSCNEGYSSINDIITKENAKEVIDILFDLFTIFSNKKEEHEYNTEYKSIIKSLMKLVKNSNNFSHFSSDDNDNDNKSSMIYIYQLIYKLCTTNEDAASKFLDKGIISNLLGKLENEKKNIRKIIYDIVIYLIKQTKEYNKELFDLEEGEKEGTIDFNEKQSLKQVSEKIINALFIEKKELLIILLTIFANEDLEFSDQFIKEITYKLYEKYCDNEKMNDLIDVLLTLVKINDQYILERLFNVLGYSSLIIKQIPRQKDEGRGYNNDSDSDNEGVLTKKQSWPIFGEKLMNGDINKQIYEYKSLNIRDNGFCLFGLLFPNEDNENEIERENENRNRYDDDDNDDEERKFKKKAVLSNQTKKDIILELFNSCFEKNNYALFKYIYLTSAPSLKHRNIYEKMKEFVLEEDKAVNLDYIEAKEERYIRNIEKETNEQINKMKNRENKPSYRYNDDDELILPGLEEFKSRDKHIKNFIGFNSDIIPGEIVRENIIRIADASSMAMYRIEYYTKYHKKDELRKILMNINEPNEGENRDNDDKNEEKIDEENENKDNETNDDEKGKKRGLGDRDRNEKRSDDENSSKDDEDKKSENSSDDEEEERKRKKNKKRDEEETELNDSFENSNHVTKYDFSEENENKFIYSLGSKRTVNIIIEDKSINDKSKVKKTLFRFILTSHESYKKYFNAKINKKERREDLMKLNCFIPSIIHAQINSNDICNFLNASRIIGDLPFVKRDEINISIDFDK